ncbi:MAG TPA: glutamate ABC transporter substrate-binding protein, partial [Kineosporiaceae bacterium]|nr:glutamate ABC transporter substrate-binding protein [Kineosporiaceae bacterium]
ITVAGAALTGCAASTDPSRPGSGPSGAVAVPVLAAAAASCNPGATASYPPLPDTSPSSWPDGSLMQTIRSRGYLVVGVSGDTRLLGARNLLNGGRLEGFDIDIARQVAIAMFGRADDSTVHFRVITGAQRIPLVNTGAGTAGQPADGVDLVARAMTMTCDRWNNSNAAQRVAFSAVYLMAHQRLLVRADSGIRSVSELQKAKAKVCAPTGSTSLTRIQEFPGIQPVAVQIHSDCLALFQEGQVDAITGDDAILAGFKAQDPHTVITGELLENEPYGLAVATGHPEFARYLNAVLEKIKGDGTWQKVYDGWLRQALPDSPASPPAADYGRAS